MRIEFKSVDVDNMVVAADMNLLRTYNIISFFAKWKEEKLPKKKIAT